jgi:hypothetical protein
MDGILIYGDDIYDIDMIINVCKCICIDWRTADRLFNWDLGVMLRNKINMRISGNTVIITNIGVLSMLYCYSELKFHIDKAKILAKILSLVHAKVVVYDDNTEPMCKFENEKHYMMVCDKWVLFNTDSVLCINHSHTSYINRLLSTKIHSTDEIDTRDILLEKSRLHEWHTDCKLITG